MSRGIEINSWVEDGREGCGFMTARGVVDTFTIRLTHRGGRERRGKGAVLRGSGRKTEAPNAICKSEAATRMTLGTYSFLVSFSRRGVPLVSFGACVSRVWPLCATNCGSFVVSSFLRPF